MTVTELASHHRSRVIVRRWLATVIDLILLFFLCAAIGGIFSVRSATASMLMFFGAPLVYYVAFEGAIGRTPGKLLCGLIVVDETGMPPKISAVLIRTATRFVEVNPLFLGGVPAGIIADRSRYRQRWGDMLAGTYVVFIDELRNDVQAVNAEAG